MGLTFHSDINRRSVFCKNSQVLKAGEGLRSLNFKKTLSKENFKKLTYLGLKPRKRSSTTQL